MKKIAILNAIIAMILVLASCGSSNNVVNNHLISKRKYTKGFHLNSKSHYRDSNEDVASEPLKKEKVRASEITLDQTKSNSEGEREVVASNENRNAGTTESNAYAPESERTVSNPQDGPIGDSPDANNEGTDNTAKSSSSSNSHNAVEENNSANSSTSSPVESDPLMLIILIVLAIFLPPVAIAIYSGINSIFWIDLILFIIGLGGFWFFPLIGLAGLAAIVIAFLVIFDVI